MYRPGSCGDKPDGKGCKLNLEDCDCDFHWPCPVNFIHRPTVIAPPAPSRNRARSLASHAATSSNGPPTSGMDAAAVIIIAVGFVIFIGLLSDWVWFGVV